MTSQTEFRVAVITPYFQESADVLRQCLASVAEQTYGCTHFLVADGHPQEVVANAPVEQIILPCGHGDGGNIARAVGSASAMSRGFDAIAYLDADNWFYANHIESMVALHRSTWAAVCSATRTIHRLDGARMFQDQESDGARHIDTSCLFLTRMAFVVLPVWAMMPPQFGPICDRVIWAWLRTHRFVTAHNPIPTVAFRSQYQVHYQSIGEAPPPGAKSNAQSTELAMRWWRSQSPDERARWSRQMGVTIQ